MAERNKVLVALIEYFKQKGRVLDIQEYSRETDTPVRVQTIKEVFGSWKKMEIIIMATENGRAESSTDIDKMLFEAGKAAEEARQSWIEASENQDVKARREAEAQFVAEKLTANAATPEGANANKIAIGGKLPQEQQDYTAMGATVKTDPATLEQTVVDVEPELVETAVLENPKTPTEIRDAVAADGIRTAAAPVGKATAGGSTGQPSTDTVNALGADSKTNEVKTPVAKT